LIKSESFRVCRAAPVRFFLLFFPEMQHPYTKQSGIVMLLVINKMEPGGSVDCGDSSPPGFIMRR